MTREQDAVGLRQGTLLALAVGTILVLGVGEILNAPDWYFWVVVSWLVIATLIGGVGMLKTYAHRHEYTPPYPKNNDE